MAEKKPSGVESLLEALRQSGVPINESSPFGGGPEGGSSNGSGAGGGKGGGDGKSPWEGLADQIPFADKMASWGKRALIIMAIVIVIVALLAYWWFHPPISINSTDTWMFVGIFVLLPVFLVFWTRSQSYKKGTGKLEHNEGKAKRFKYLSYLPILVVVIGLAGMLVSQSFFPGNAEKYATVLTTDDHEFAEDMKEVDYSEIPIIDHNSAMLLGDRAMGEIPDYVSQFEISSLYSQINYQGTPTRVSPLGYADIIKWFNNREAGIPAYARVDMTTQKTEIVRLGDSPIRYSQSEPLVRNIDRHVQLSYPFYIFDEKSFEIDEEGHPWWICPVRTYTIGLFGGQTVERVIMCDATTGETQDLAIEDIPQWVDRAYPADLLIQQYNWSGAYQDGWLNSWLGQQGVVQTTKGTNTQQGYNYIAKDDDVWVYTGVTSATADSSIVGFVLVNQRTHESHFYQVSGATEESAMSSAQGQVQHLGYQATFPILINVGGQPTYFMALKDAAGLVKQFAMLDIQRYQNVSTAETVAETQKSYEQLLVTNGIVTSGELQEVGNSASGVIASMAQAVIDGNSHFYLRLEGDSNIYDFALPGMISIVSYSIGDTISFEYQENDSPFTVLEITNPNSELKAKPASEKDEGTSAESAAA